MLNAVLVPFYYYRDHSVMQVVCPEREREREPGPDMM